MVAKIGNVSWTDNDLRNSLKEFSEIYKQRPILDNTGGMKSPHMFPTWFVAKMMKTKYIIESGVFKGQGTWLFEQASPESEIICIEINPNAIIYKSKNAQYLDKDMTNYDWSWIKEKDQALVFLDDHQNAYERIKFLIKNGFKYSMFEDNYPLTQGDCFSLKKAFHSPDLEQELSHILSVYYEFPPIYKLEYTRWKDKWEGHTYSTPEPLLASTDEEYQKIYFDEANDYTWICYVEAIC